MKIFIGVDLHKIKQTWVGIGTTGSEKLFSKEFYVTPEGVKEAICYAKFHGEEISIAIEPCCGWMWVVDQLREAKIDVHITNPRKVRAIADSLQKTDENDAYTLARLLRTEVLCESRTLDPETQKFDLE